MVVPSSRQLWTSYSRVQTSLPYNVLYSYRPLLNKFENCGLLGMER